MNTRKFFTIILCVLGVCLAILSGIIVAGKMLPDVMGGIASEDFQNLSVPEAKGRVNILALGVDADGTRTDTIMLASLDNENKKLSVMSIPRDTRVNYKGRYDKITHLFGKDKKGNSTIEAVKNLTGLDIHYCVVVNYQGFRDVIDALGGVEIDVPHVPNGWSNGRRGMYYEDPYQDLHIALPEGRQVLNGEQSEHFVRFRNGYANADLDRIKNQQYFFTELFEQKVQPKYILKANELIKIVNESVKSNYTVSAMASQLLTIKSMDVSTDVETMSLPGEGRMLGTVSYFIYEPVKTQEIIENFFLSSDGFAAKIEETTNN